MSVPWRALSTWYQGSDGLLGVTAVGLHRFRVISSFREANGLNVGSIEVLPDEPVVQIPDEYQSMPSILAGVLRRSRTTVRIARAAYG